MARMRCGKMGRSALSLLTLGPIVIAPVHATGRSGILPPESRRQHDVTVNGQRLTVVAALERYQAQGRSGRPLGSVYLTSLTAHSGDSRRPVIFAFNGGPGSSSAYLNLGMMGLRRVQVSGPEARGPTGTIVDNHDTPLDVADIVLIDPIGTGFSRLASRGAAGEAYSAVGDAAYIAGVIRQWLKRHHREAAPAFLAGESYGAQRVASILRVLSCDGKRHCTPLPIEGAILISQSIEIVNTLQRPGNVTGIAAGFPTIAALAWYHRKVDRHDRSVDGVVADALAFSSIYLSALYRGNSLSVDERSAIAGKLAAFSGLAPAYFQKHLSITKDEYRHEAFRSTGQVLGTYDARYLGPVSGAGDPSTNALDTVIAAKLSRVLNESVGVPAWYSYRVYNDALDGRWTYAPVATPFSKYDYAGEFAAALRINPALKVLVAGGLYDTAASVGADAFLLNQWSVPATQTLSVHYPAGHMFYLDDASRVDFARAIRCFVGSRSIAVCQAAAQSRATPTGIGPLPFQGQPDLAP